MKRRLKTLLEVRLAGLEALTRELGPVGMILFLQQYESGKGDYSVDRHRLLEKSTVKALNKKIREHRKPEK